MSRPGRLEAVAQHDVERLPDGRWRVVGPASLISLQPEAGMGLPLGDVRLSVAIDAGEAVAATHATLVVDSGRGLTRGGRIPLPSPRGGRITALVTLPPGTQALALDPGPGTFSLGEVRATALHPLSAALAHALPQVGRLARHPEQLLVMAGRAARLLRYRGFAGVLARLRQGTRRQDEEGGYSEWVSRFATLSDPQRAELGARVARLAEKPLVSLWLMPGAAAGPALRSTLEGLRRQLYPRWELLVVDKDVSVETRALFRQVVPGDVVRFVSQGITPADVHGTWVARFQAGDVLEDHALWAVVNASQGSPRVALVYTDEDRQDAKGQRSSPAFKPGWSPELLRSRNYIGRAAFFRADRLRQLGTGWSGMGEDAQHELLLRFTVGLAAEQIRHVPAVLLHTLPEPSGLADATEDGVRMLQAHLDGLGVAARAMPGLRPRTYHVRYTLPAPVPRVTVIIPTRDHAMLLRRCVQSLQQATAYPALELLVVDNDSRQWRARSYLDALDCGGEARVLRYPHPFNYSAINNLAAQAARGEVVCFLNNDVEAFEPDWLTEMVGLALQPGIGAVGAKLLYPNDTVQHAGVVAGLLGVASHHYVREPRNSDGYLLELQVCREVSAMIAACMVIRRDRFLAVGGFDEVSLRIGFSDVDLCFKLLRAGYRNLWTPFAELRHLESASRGRDERPADRQRFLAEESVMRQRWADLLGQDPYYSPNLSLDSNVPRPAWPPRPSADMDSLS